jgi:hypothetical protein
MPEQIDASAILNTGQQKVPSLRSIKSTTCPYNKRSIIFPAMPAHIIPKANWLPHCFISKRFRKAKIATSTKTPIIPSNTPLPWSMLQAAPLFRVYDRKKNFGKTVILRPMSHLFAKNLAT